MLSFQCFSLLLVKTSLLISSMICFVICWFILYLTSFFVALSSVWYISISWSVSSFYSLTSQHKSHAQNKSIIGRVPALQHCSPVIFTAQLLVWHCYWFKGSFVSVGQYVLKWTLKWVVMQISLPTCHIIRAKCERGKFCIINMAIPWQPISRSFEGHC